MIAWKGKGYCAESRGEYCLVLFFWELFRGGGGLTVSKGSRDWWVV